MGDFWLYDGDELVMKTSCRDGEEAATERFWREQGYRVWWLEPWGRNLMWMQAHCPTPVDPDTRLDEVLAYGKRMRVSVTRKAPKT